MAQMIVSLEARLPWWRGPFIKTLVAWAWLTGRGDPQKAGQRIARGCKLYTVDKSGRRRRCR